jgi:hypothetical protein
VSTNPHPKDGSVFVPFQAPCLDPLIEENQHFVVENCYPEGPQDYKKFIQIKQHKDNFVVYCPGAPISIQGVNKTCDKDVMIVPTGFTMFIDGNKALGNIHVLKNEELDAPVHYRVQQQLRSQLNWTALEMEEKAEFKRIRISDFHPAIWTTIGSGSLVLVLLVALLCCGYNLKQMQSMPPTITVIPQRQVQAIEA